MVAPRSALRRLSDQPGWEYAGFYPVALFTDYSAAGMLFNRADPANNNQWETTAKTTLVDASGDPVGYYASRDPNGNDAQQPTSAARPTLTLSGGTWFHSLDGGDYWQTPVVPSASMTVVVGFRSDVVGVSQHLLSCNSGSPSVNARFYFGLNADGTARFGYGTNSTLLTGAADLRGADKVLSIRLNGSTAGLWVGNSLVASASLPGSAPTRAVYIGAVNDTTAVSGYFSGRIYAVFAIKAALSDDDFLAAREHVAALSGVTL